MRILRWVIVILTLAAAPGTIRKAWHLLNYGSERETSEYALRVGFCVFFITLGLRLLGGSKDREE
jgi:hypothetical protein